MDRNPEECQKVQEAQRLLERLVLEGLRHGHFEYGVSCEVTNAGKRRLLIKAGKSHVFLISKEELEA